MIRQITFSLFLFLCNVSFAQISFSVSKQDVKCNRTALGELEISVTSSLGPYSFNWNTGDTTSTLQNLNEGVYTVLITDDVGNDTSVSIEIKVSQCEMAPEIVFTPNNDGINDTWFILNANYFSKARFMVFNRLGQKVFEQNGLYQLWDGKDLFGVTLPDASYYYVIYHDQSDESSIIKGCVSIVK